MLYGPSPSSTLMLVFPRFNRVRSGQPLWTSQRNPRLQKRRSERTPMSQWSQCQPTPCSSGTRRPTSKLRTPTPPSGRCQRSWPPCGTDWEKNRNRYILQTLMKVYFLKMLKKKQQLTFHLFLLHSTQNLIIVLVEMFKWSHQESQTQSPLRPYQFDDLPIFYLKLNYSFLQVTFGKHFTLYVAAYHLIKDSTSFSSTLKGKKWKDLKKKKVI